MKLLFVLRDEVAQIVVGEITSERTIPSAVRSFYDLLADERTVLAKHPADYVLVHVGDMDDRGHITPAYNVVATGAGWVEAQAAKGGES